MYTDTIQLERGEEKVANGINLEQNGQQEFTRVGNCHTVLTVGWYIGFTLCMLCGKDRQELNLPLRHNKCRSKYITEFSRNQSPW